MRAPELEAQRTRAANGDGRDANGALHPAHLQRVHRAHVSAVEAIGDAQDRGEPLDLIAQRLVERAEVAMLFPWRRAAMIARDVRDHHLLGRRDAEQLGVHDEVVRVLVVPIVVDVIADVVQQRGVGERGAIVGRTAEPAAQRVEQSQGEPLDLQRVRLLEVTALGELAHGALARRAGIRDGGTTRAASSRSPSRMP